MKNPGLREAIALTLAVILWFYVRVTRTGGTSLETQVQVSVPIQLRGQSSKLTIYEMSHDQIKVTVQGNSQEMAGLREQHIQATVDLTGEEASSIYPRVKVLVPPQFRVVSSDPETINIKQAALITKQVPFRVTVSGAAAKGRGPARPSSIPRARPFPAPSRW